MGSIFSCLASTCIYLGEFLENVFLALGEIGAVLVRAIIGIVVSLCDLLAAISCCYRVPWSERPDRSFYAYTTNAAAVNTNGNSTLATVGGKQGLSSVFTKQGREQRKQMNAARKKAAALKAEEVATAQSVNEQATKAEQEKSGAIVRV